MARDLLARRYWERIDAKQQRREPGIVSYWHVEVWPDFIDYWGAIPGTIPEKMVFDLLVRLQINFKFSWYIGDLEITPELKEHIRPDFILTDYKIIIEVFGVYWHSLPGSAAKDAFRAALLTAEGWDVRIVTDVSLIEQGAWITIMEAVPELRTARFHGNQAEVGDRPFDPTAAIKARLRKWPRVFTPGYRVKKQRISWDTMGKIKSPKKPGGPLFLGPAPPLAWEWIDPGPNSWEEDLALRIADYYRDMSKYNDSWPLAKRYDYLTGMLVKLDGIISLLEAHGQDASAWHKERSDIRYMRDNLT